MRRATARIEVYSNAEALVGRAVSIVRTAATRGPVALSGGETTLPVYAAVAAAGVSGSWYQVDERCVAYEHPDSNGAAIERAGLSIHRIRTEKMPEDAAASYEREVRTAWGGAPFALAVLGIGDDGHTASLFPGAPEVGEDRAWVVATRHEHFGHRRITMTLPLLNAIGERVFIATGAAKREAVHRAIAGHDEIPATLVRDPLWLLDAAAAGDLS